MSLLRINSELTLDDNLAVFIDYTNYRGERRVRKVIPIKIHFIATEHHKKQQWLMNVYDLEKREFRSYAFSGIHGMYTMNDPTPPPWIPKDYYKL